MPEAFETPQEQPDPLLGCLLQDRYRLLEQLGRGGMGVVYLADHVMLRRKVAIKMLHPQLTRSAESLGRFLREARAAAAVGNQHVVDVTDMGRLPDGSYFIAMEYLDGRNLANLIEARGPLPPERAIAIAVQVCAALEAVHAAGIVHRDLKPENVFLVHRGNTQDFVKVLDFGICKVLDDSPLTATGVAVGTPRYMSPEQLEARADIDQRTDVYGVGIILFCALAGEGPHDRLSLPKLLLSVWNDPAPPLRSLRPDVPEVLERIVARALEKDRTRRFADARELRAALESCLAGREPVLTEPELETRPTVVPPVEPNEGALSIPGVRRGRRRLLAASGLIAATVAVSLYASAVGSDLGPVAPEVVQRPPPPRQVERDTAALPASGLALAPAAVPAEAPAPVSSKSGKRGPHPRPALVTPQPAVAEPSPPPAESEPEPAPVAAVPPVGAGASSEPMVPRPAQLKQVF